MMTGLTGLTVVVVGLGPMGRGIARIFAAAGAATTVVDRDEPTTVAGARTLQTEAEVDGVPVTVRPVADLATAVAGADLLIEAVVEDMGVKRELLAESRRWAAGTAGGLEHRPR